MKSERTKGYNVRKERPIEILGKEPVPDYGMRYLQSTASNTSPAREKLF